MIWHYFPIGMRFPVADFSEQTKRACWKIALSAIFASDARETGLYEACETFDPGSQGPVYTCIVCYYGVKQSRPAGKTMQSLDALTARLCLHNPLVQANYLESFGPYPVLAEIDAEGKIHSNENGAAFIPTEPVEPMKPCAGFDEGRMRCGKADAHHRYGCGGPRVSRMQNADRGRRGRNGPRACRRNEGPL